MPTTTGNPDPNSFKQWPDEVLKVYGQLPLPSIYDFILANEKVACELRRQSKDIHKLVSAILTLRDQIKGLDDHLQMEVVDLSSDSLSETSESDIPLEKSSSGFSDSENEPTNEGYYPAWEVDMMRQAGKLEQRQWEEIYIAMLEVILQTFEENENVYKNAVEILKGSKLGKAVEFAIEQLLLQHNAKIQSIRDQMFAHLKDIDLEPITPSPGDLYDEDIHRVIDTVPANRDGKHKRNTIARVIRIGYRRHGELVRQADVCVYG